MGYAIAFLIGFSWGIIVAAFVWWLGRIDEE